MLFLALPSSARIWPLVGILAMCANVGFGASVVAMNAYLPTLSARAPEVVALRAALDAQRARDPVVGNALGLEGVETPLLAHAHAGADADGNGDARAAHDAQLSLTTARISAQGIALGYSAGIGLLLLALVPVTLMGGSTFSLRLAIALSGAWWACFSVPAALWLPAGACAGSSSRTTAPWT